MNVTSATATKAHVSHLTLVDLTGGDDPYTLKLLENHYAVKAVYVMPAGVSLPTGSAKFVIIEP